MEDRAESLRRELVAAGFSANPGALDSFDGLGNLLREHAEASADSTAAEQFLAATGPAWAEADLPVALDWVQAHLKGANRVEAGAQLFSDLAEKNFDEALRVWQSLPDTMLKARAAGAIWHHAPPARREEALALLDSLSRRGRRVAFDGLQ